MQERRRPSSIYDLLEDEYGVSFIEQEDPEGIVDVDAADKTMLRADPSRTGFLLMNLSSGTVFLRPGVSAAVADTGIRLGPNGGQVFVAWRDDGSLPAKEWHVIGSAGNLAIYLLTYRLPVGG